ncbi:hypothetical protein M0805_000449 [Coniferiporia weirii]|nr:hypothetical protein M0805_000449 [Coniferiporia weirii]
MHKSSRSKSLSKRTRNWRAKGRAVTIAVSILCWILLVHLAGLFLFTKGFLLSRMVLPNISSCAEDGCTLPPTHQRLVLLVVDALRFDFISPDPPAPNSPFYYNVLTLPRELSAQEPERSFLYNSYADPPTTTMQRIKGITTGSLPTFVEVKSSFEGSLAEGDSIIYQLYKAKKRTAFLGDSTWLTVFPTLFSPNMTHPEDPLNVEDLHTGDNAIIRNLFQLLEDKSGSWDVIVGHFLGIDHAAHRAGPDHFTMKEKLLQMDSVLRRVVDLLEDDTLLVVLGDHGMDREGNHGSDDIFQTSAAMWIYSKGILLQDNNNVKAIPSETLPKLIYPGASVAHRWVQQIDIVPSLSLLLGLPIPFNNLGSIIPELFAREADGHELALDLAVKANAEQIRQYINAYLSSPHGGKLHTALSSLSGVSWGGTSQHRSTDNNLAMEIAYMRSILKMCRSHWARFNVLRMSNGLIILGLSVVIVAIIYSRLGSVTDWEGWASKRFNKVVRYTGTGVAVGLVVHFTFGQFLRSVDLIDILLITASMSSCMTFLLDAVPTCRLPSVASIPLSLLLHALCFLSISFTFWEDHVVPFLLITSIIPAVYTGLASHNERLRRRILLSSVLFALCVRLMALSTVCREEQQPHCNVTFYSSPTSSLPPTAAIILSLPTSLILPSIICRFAGVHSPDRNTVTNFLAYVLRTALIASSIFWILEWMEISQTFGADKAPLIRIARTVIARCTFLGLLVSGTAFWWLNPLCSDISVPAPRTIDEGPDAMDAVDLNLYGLSFILLWSIGFALVYLASQLTSQIVLALGFVALLAHLEVASSVRIARTLDATSSILSPSAVLKRATDAPFTFDQFVPLVQLGILAFHATGHQATISSIQLKSAFLLTPVVAYPASRIALFLNTFGPPIVFALAAPLIACWKRACTASVDPGAGMENGSIRAAIGVMLCYALFLFSSAAGAMWLREHPMLWSVLAPRVFSAAICLVFVDLSLVVAVGVLVGMHKRTPTRAARPY